MARKRPDRSRCADRHFRSIEEFRSATIIPLLAEVRPAGDQAKLAQAVNETLMALADDLVGKKDSLLTRGHSNPPMGD